MSDFIQLEDWMVGLLEKFTPAQRRKLTQQWARKLRQSQQKRIQQQLNPDGSPYEARKPQKRDKKGRVKRKMFRKIRTARYLKTKATPDMAEVSFSNSRIERIAATHQYGLREKLGKRGPVVKYPQRELLGINMASDKDIPKIFLELLFEF
ncbi:phage virion morphogenesis protein [Obesumbacterium proteus]|uniref:phage virion morphogenesis protein n=1 Tax=Obesumbacterium proteus TaxID=82983 RepID=UPI001033D08E|nr:phage virion morphogenesis protein [Obesumbacterium proteus]TBL75818.1 phage virion morphogenesis protein [Obesumbacterium proteus]